MGLRKQGEGKKMENSIAKQLQQARQERQLTLEDVAKATHIRLHYLQAMEAGDFSSLPSPAQARGFLRAYASYLGLDLEALLGEFGGGSSALPLTQRKYEAAMHGPPDPAMTAVSLVTSQPTPTQPVTAGSDFFYEIGKQLRQRREVLGLSLDEVEAHTHIRVGYLQALEAGQVENLPSSMQGRGMLANYASFLGLDPDPLLMKYADGIQARFLARQSERKQMRPFLAERAARPPSVDHLPHPPGPIRRLFASEVIWAGLLLLGLLGFIGWGTVRVLSAHSAPTEEAPTPPSIVDVLLATATLQEAEILISPSPSATLAPFMSTLPVASDVIGETSQPSDVAGQPTAISGNLRLGIIARQRAWMRVTVDGNVVFEGRILGGSAQEYYGQERIELLTGDGAALQVYYNQQDLGPFGQPGEVVNRIFTIEGILTPTPTVTRTPTATQAVTATPKP